MSIRNREVNVSVRLHSLYFEISLISVYSILKCRMPKLNGWAITLSRFFQIIYLYPVNVYSNITLNISPVFSLLICKSYFRFLSKSQVRVTGCVSATSPWQLYTVDTNVSCCSFTCRNFLCILDFSYTYYIPFLIYYFK